MLPELLPYVHRFVELVVAKTSPRAIVLYGSVARGEATRSSDVDVCVVVRGKRGRDVAYSAASEVNSRLADAGLKSAISPMIVDASEDVPSELMNEGITLWGSAVRVSAGKFDLVPMSLVTYEMSGLGRNVKSKVSRILHGHRTKKTHKGKTYVSESEGLIRTFGANHLGNALLLGRERSAPLLNLFRTHGVKHAVLDVFVHSEVVR